MARPKAKIDLAEVEKLSMMQSTDEEIAAWFGVTARTIARRRKMRPFREAMERGRAKGRISVRRMQMKLLESGNATMGVWLGKQMLGQTEPANQPKWQNDNGRSPIFSITVPVSLQAPKKIPPASGNGKPDPDES
jgi:hypothetical protein